MVAQLQTESQTKSKRYSPEEYLELEEQAQARSEYRDGEIVLMAGGTVNHNRIAGAFYRAIPDEIGDQVYEGFIGDMKVWIPQKRMYPYPDVLVVAGEPAYHAGRQDIIENQLLIVEVLSKSTQQYDQTDKFDAYRTISSLQEYIMIDQYSYWVKQFVRGDRGQWIFTELIGQDAILQLGSIDFEIILKQLYQRVQFEPNAELSSDAE
ncbi:MAG: Uma2 family endonuclease [Spirulina sp. SIO3F2]|nr:Uma2 family endonuclease [Spirulina sp. SIO3F2]